MATNTKLTSLFIFHIIYSVSLISAFNGEPPNYLKNSILLQPGDLKAHLNSLKSIIEFGVRRPNDIDATMFIGFFFNKVNLKWALEKKEAGLSDPLKREIINLLSNNEEILQNYNYTVDITDTPFERMAKKIVKLFRDDETWIRGIKTFNRDEVISDRGVSDEHHLAGYIEYTNTIFDFNNMRPQPEESDTCLLHIAEKPTHKRLLSKCDTSDKCIDMLTAGSPYGYAVTHRLLWLLVARLSRGCYLISPEEDSALADSLCTTIYKEAEYIWANNYEHFDLLLEQIALCSLDGHKAFFQRTWMAMILNEQKSSGCFDVKQMTKKSRGTTISNRKKRAIVNPNYSIADGTCNAHVTAVATGAISAAVRYIIDTFYGRPGI